MANPRGNKRYDTYTYHKRKADERVRRGGVGFTRPERRRQVEAGAAAEAAGSSRLGTARAVRQSSNLSPKRYKKKRG